MISASSGATGAIMPFIIKALLDRYGYRTKLWLSALAMVILAGPLIPLFRVRLPVSETVILARTDWGFMMKPLFWVYSSAILSQGLGFFYPVVFLPSYATLVGLSSLNGALLLALLSIAQVVGQCALGYLSDKSIPVGILSVICCLVAAMSSFTLWGLGHSMPLLAVFALIYGFFGFGFGTLRVAMGRAISDDASVVFSTYSIFVFLQGIGNIIVSPISAARIRPSTDTSMYAGGSYNGNVWLTGATSIFAAIIISGWVVETF